MNDCKKQLDPIQLVRFAHHELLLEASLPLPSDIIETDLMTPTYRSFISGPTESDLDEVKKRYGAPIQNTTERGETDGSRS